ncbi:MAG: tetratricopeptide repeat protein [Chloroflexi bacterium]|nr:tetratricopeptide repeat protein [Chloroflexota bacterium]
MPNDKAIFQDAIKKGHNAAWDGQWQKAVTEYQRALNEFPDDITVRLSLAHALEGAGKLEDALRAYQMVAQRQPSDPAPLTSIAGMLEKLKRSAEAAGMYVTIAEVYLTQKQSRRAVEAWQNAARLEPDRSDVHQNLADAFERDGRRAQAANEYVTLAGIHQRRGDTTKALALAQRALEFDPRNTRARALLDDLQPREQTTSVSATSPVGEAEKAALTRLAETLLEEHAVPKEITEERRADDRPALSQSDIDALIARAVDAQTQRRVGEAMEAYRTLINAGVARPEVKFNLGLLYFETMRYDDAIALLSDTVSDKNLALASHYALGQCYRAEGRMDEAVEHYLQVLKIVDLGSVRRDQADELIAVYEGIAESYAAKGDHEKMESFAGALEQFLTNKGWEDKLREARTHLDALRTEGSHASLAEIIQLSDSDKMLEALAVSQEYLRRGKLFAAMEECYRAIQIAPGYLPSHVRVAEILIKQDRYQDARAKYEALADLSMVRNDLVRAELFYRHALNIEPNDVSNRTRLIDLLTQQNKTGEALEQYLSLGEVNARNGQLAKALERYSEGIRYAARAGATNSPFALNLRHRLAETRARQGDFKGAFAAYQEIRQQSPDDERAHFYVIDLQLRQGQTEAALRDLDDLLKRYRARGESSKVLGVLEALTQAYANDAELIHRLAQDYAAAGAVEQAVAALDALGEAQMRGGQRQAAAETIRQIIALNPPRVEDYRNLLQEISE